MIINPYAFGGGSSATDPNFANVVTLLHCDGADASTTFFDQTGKSWTPSGTAQIDTAQFKFGSASGLVSGNNLTCTHSDFNGVANGDFTFEAWCRAGSLSSNMAVFGMGDSGSNYWQFTVHPTSGLVINIFGSNILSQGGTAGLSTNTWMHIAYVRSGNNLYGFVDGVLRASSANGASLPSVVSTKMHIASNHSPGSFWDGHLDDIRITKGVARYTSGFTPPTAAFPNS